jgi:hypothetical protein
MSTFLSIVAVVFVLAPHAIVLWKPDTNPLIVPVSAFAALATWLVACIVGAIEDLKGGSQ